MAASAGYVLAQLQRWTTPRLKELPDPALLERFVQRGDESAFAALVYRHGAMVLRSCQRILGDVHDAEDAFQATFLVLARKAHTLRHPSELPGWLHGVARRVALKARTRAAVRASQTPLPDELADGRPDPLSQVTARELLKVLEEEVAHLPLAQRSAVVLCCLEGQTREEAARALGCTLGSLKGSLERGRQRLQAQLRKRGIDLTAALAIVEVSRGEAVSALLLRSTVTAALGGTIGVSASVLAQGVLKTMFLTKLAGVMALTLTLALAAVTTAVLVCRGSTAEAPEDEKSTVAAASQDAGAGKPKARTDALGDPLPEGAIARLGSQRFRHSDEIDKVSFASDGKRLISQGMDGVRFWDAATGKELRHIFPKEERFWIGEDLSPDGKWLVGKYTKPNPSFTESLELWETESGRKIADVGEGFCANACFSPDGKLLAFVSKFQNVCIYDLKGRKILRTWQGDARHVWSIAFSADSRQLITSERTGLVRLWDAATGRQLQEFKPKGGAPQPNLRHEYTALSPDGKLLALIENNEKQTPAAGKVEWKARVSVRDAMTGKQVRLLTCTAKEFVPGFTFPFISLLFRRDSKRLLTSGPDEFLREWDAATGEELRRIVLPPEMPYSLRALSRDEKQLAAARPEGRAIQLIDLIDGKVREEPAGHQAPVDLAILSPDGRTAITNCLPGSALIWDAAKGTLRHRFDNQGLLIFGLRLAGDGRTLFSTSTDNIIRVWDMETGKQQRAVKVRQGFMAEGNGIVVSRDGKFIVLVDRQLGARTIRVLDGETGQEKQHFQANSTYYLSLSADGRWLVGWGLERKVHVWDLAAGTKGHEYALPPDPLGGIQAHSRYRAAASPDGRLFAVCTQRARTAENVKSDNWLIVKDLSTGRDVHSIRNPPSDYGVMAFSQDGRTLAYSGTFDGTIRFLEVASGKERHRFTGLQGRASALSFCASGDRLISGCTDSTALIWDLGLRPAPRPASAEELKHLWADLAGEDAARAYQAIRKLAASPSSAIPFMRKFLHPAAAVEEKRVARLIADLDSDDFAKRDSATAELQKFGEQALAIYRKNLADKPALELRRRLEALLDKAQRAWWEASGERLRSLRAIEALELAGAKEARELLKTLAAGAEGARLTEEAKAALDRLANRRESANSECP